MIWSTIVLIAAVSGLAWILANVAADIYEREHDRRWSSGGKQ